MISIIVPFYNEDKNIPVLIDELHTVCGNEKYEYEIVLVDDGSDTPFKVKEGHAKNIIIARHRKRKGKGEALRTGVRKSSGDILVFMDGDLQDDPADLPKFMEKIKGGADLVNGVRQKRIDSPLIKMYSFFANATLHTLFHSPFTDINCGFKMFKKELLAEYPLYGNNFRFFPLSVFYKGYSVDEVVVNNRKRISGVSKFGSLKVFTGILDMLTAYFVFLFSDRPLHFFGIIGGVLFVAGFVVSAYLAYERIFYHVMLYRRPLLLFGIVLIIVGIEVIMTGLIGELIVYFNKIRK